MKKKRKLKYIGSAKIKVKIPLWRDEEDIAKMTKIPSLRFEDYKGKLSIKGHGIKLPKKPIKDILIDLLLWFIYPLTVLGLIAYILGKGCAR